MKFEKRRLGKSDIEITPIGLGVWQFSGGKGPAGSYWPTLGNPVMNDIVRVSLEGGINWFDTAEAYGNGNSEQALAAALKAAGKSDGEVVVATKWWPVLKFAGALKKSIDERLRYLNDFSIDLYQVHQPFSLSSVEKEMAAMADLVDRKKIRTVGVSNFSALAMGRAHWALAERKLPLVSNQVKYSLLDRRIEFNGTLATAKEQGITIIAYSPLEQGLLTGKFHKNADLINQLSPMRRTIFRLRSRSLKTSRPVIEALEDIAAVHGATPAQVALNWLISFHGPTVVAIPGATKVSQAEENVGALNFELSGSEKKRLDILTRDFWY